jgi:N-methylhydantoinase B/oxoprolinase/acetone carboxylase alpha subunit
MGTWGGQVFNEGQLIFFVASRGHHAEIGGITPGSMPPFSKAIWEEGAAIKAFKLVEGGVFQVGSNLVTHSRSQGFIICFFLI